MEEKKGYVEHIIYRNQENGYTVFEFVSQEEGEEYLDTCVGTFPFINEGEYLTLYGDMVTHPTYHEQFKVQKVRAVRRMTRCRCRDIWHPVRSKGLEVDLPSGS